uniref:Uncharacterized protein n=1 Tax=Oryza rufipogon TaxID=4529 RepID=A0A0E0Q5L1_ORYRU
MAVDVLSGGVLGAAARAVDDGRRWLRDEAGLMIRTMATEALDGGVLEVATVT